MTLDDKIKSYFFNKDKKMHTLLHETNYMLSHYFNKNVV